MNHPLKDFELRANNIKCFGDNNSGFYHFAPISVVIGKNNSGKSTIIDTIEIAINLHKSAVVRESQRRANLQPSLDIKYQMQKEQLKSNFSESTSGGPIPGNHWEFGSQFIGRIFTWRELGSNQRHIIAIDENQDTPKSFNADIRERLNKSYGFSLRSTELLRVAAERRVIPEKKSQPTPSPTGDGITNLIRYFITSDSKPRDAVEVDLLNDLNKIYLGDSHFKSIICQENDQNETWEIFLRDSDKGDIRLSESGSSLQSIFIILSYLRLVPQVESINWQSLVLAIEEPENNLHPALLRRLLNFLASERDKLGFSLVFTTHSPICIDWSARRSDSTIIHVKKEGDQSRAENVFDYENRAKILTDLEVRGSDILQSNGIIWVEGPSDRIYLKKWIELSTDLQLVEGSHYTFMFYGGKILSHFDSLPPDELSEKIQMLAVNRNAAIVIDSDRNPTPGKTKSGKIRRPRMNLGNTKREIIDQISRQGGFSWVTAGKEIENYIPASIWSMVVGEPVSITSEYINIPNLPAVKKNYRSKVDLARAAEPLIEKADLKTLDLNEQVESLVREIKTWNNL